MAGEILDNSEANRHQLPKVEAALRTGMADFVQPAGSVPGPASTSVVSAINPV